MVSIDSASSSISAEIILEKISEVTLRLQQEQELESILQWTIADIQSLLCVDRVCIGRFQANEDAVIALESVAPDVVPMLGHRMVAPGVDAGWVTAYRQGQRIPIAEVQSGAIERGYREVLDKFQVQANIVVPLFQQDRLWGLLIAHECRSVREWHPLELRLVQHVALLLELAIQQKAPHQWARTEQVLRENEAALATAQRVARVGNWRFDALTGQITWSEELFRIYGLDPAQPEPDLAAHIQLIHPDDRERFQTTVQQALLTGESYVIEFKSLCADGSVQFVEGRGEAIFDDQGRVVGLFGTAQDITDRKQKEELIQNVAMGVSAAVGEAFFHSLVHYLIRLLGMDQAFVGELIAPEHNRIKVIAGAGYAQCVDGLEYPLAGTPCETVVRQGFCIYPDGVQQRFPADQTLQVLGGEGYIGIPLLNATGAVIGLIGVIANHPIANVRFIEEVLTIFAVRAASELERQQSEGMLRRYERIVSATPDCVSLLDRHYIYQVVNQTYLNWNQKSYDEIVGHSVSDLLGQDFFESFSKPCLDRCLTKGLQQSFETWQSYPDGQRRYIRATYSPYVELNGTIAGVVVNVHDLTDLKLIEEALRQSEERFRQMADSIHEVFWMVDIDFNRLIYVSPCYETIWGRSCESLYQQPRSFLDAIHPEDRTQVLTVIAQQQQGFDHEYRLLHPDGTVRWIWERAYPVIDATGKPYRLVGVSQDITDRKMTEIALREQQQFTEQIASSTLAVLYVQDLIGQRIIYANQQVQVVLGYAPHDIQTMGSDRIFQLIHPDDQPTVVVNHQRLLQVHDDEFVETEYRVRHKAGGYRWLLSRDRIFSRTPEGLPRLSLGVATDITMQKDIQTSLHQQVERQRLLTAIAQRIRQTLDLDHILHTTVTEVRQFLQTDRVIIYRFEPDWSGIIIAESVATGWRSLLGMQIIDTYFVDTQGVGFEHDNIKATDDIYAIQLDPCHQAMLEQMQVRAKMMVPILQDDRLWGLLVAQHCQSPRHWGPVEIELQQQLATQIAIAIQQANLYQQSQAELAERQRAETALQQLNQQLEQRVQERTESLHYQAMRERLLRLIIQDIHRSLDLKETLATVLSETRHTLEADRVAIYQFNPDWSGSFVAESMGEGWVPLVSPNVRRVWEDTHLKDTQGGRYRHNEPFAVADIYTVGHHQCHIDLLEQFQARAYAIAPIFLDDRLWGLLAVYQNRGPRNWQEWEISLLQQIGIQLAIALRQSYLYQAVQAQVTELERLNQLKDDFLSTVSHELRSPMSSIKMAIQMLEINLKSLGALTDESNAINRYLRILREEGNREVNLINDLLDLSRLDAGTDSLNLTPIDLRQYIAKLAEPFIERMRPHQQHFVSHIPADLPPWNTDVAFLERILTELLHNACKYTPSGETIAVSVQSTPTGLSIRISNSGVEIPTAECHRIFDKFYRIPKNDPWKHGGTGLGLALVKKLTERLGGTIHVESGSNQTTFVLEFTCAPAHSPDATIES